MIKAGRVLTALALAALLAPSAMAAPLTAQERAMLRDSAKAQEVLTARVANARTSAESLTASAPRLDDEKAAKRAEQQARFLGRTILKAERALGSQSYKSALVFVKRAEALMASQGVQQ